jgi:hypothetical protein
MVGLNESNPIAEPVRSTLFFSFSAVLTALENANSVMAISTSTMQSRAKPWTRRTTKCRKERLPDALSHLNRGAPYWASIGHEAVGTKANLT